MALDKSLQKLRSLLNEAFNKLRLVNEALKQVGEYLSEKPVDKSKSRASSAQSVINGALQNLLSSSSSSLSSSSSAAAAAAAETSKVKKDKASDVRSPKRSSHPTTTTTTTTTTTKTTTTTGGEATNLSSSSVESELCGKHAVNSMSAATLNQILETQTETTNLVQSIRHKLLVNSYDDDD